MPEQITPEFTKGVRINRHQLAKVLDPLRPDLFRYCRSLTGDLWDAEDLVQDTLFRAFAKLADVHWNIDNPRAWLFRVASNLWIDQMRRPREAVMPDHFDAPDAQAAPSPEIADAIAELAHRLPPQERAALLLKDVFDFSLAEIAAQLRTSTGAIKAALHRARKTLAQASQHRNQQDAAGREPQAKLAQPLLEAWCAAFNARDLQGLANLLLADAEAEVVGICHEYTREQIRDGSLHHTVLGEDGDPEAKLALFRGEPVVLLWYTVQEAGTSRRVVRDVLRFEQQDGGLRRMRYYYFCPQTLAEVTAELGLPLVDNGYRYG